MHSPANLLMPACPLSRVGAPTDRPVSGQIGGYPFRWCFTVGGTQCTDGSTRRKNVLQPATRWKTCTGNLGCSAAITGPISGGGSELSTIGGVDDWTDCCRECGEAEGCAQWQYALDGTCLLLDSIGTAQPLTGSASDVSFFTGTPGQDDPPLECQERNQYDTCTLGPECPDAGDPPDEPSPW